MEAVEVVPPHGVEEGEGLATSDEIEGLAMPEEVIGSGWANASRNMHVYMYMQNCQSCDQYTIIMAFNAIFEPIRTVPFTGHVTIAH